MMSEDAELLRRYATERSESAFAELIRRHVDLVYSAALRLVNGDTHCAQDLSQQVFTELARRAKPLARHPALVGWLYTTTRQMAWHAIRSEQRRAAREQMAHTMSELLRPPAAEPDWEHLRPVLEDAMHDLNDADRVAVLLRFFKNKSLRQVGLELGLTENAARMRVERALEKLRLCLARKGVTSTGAALALALSGNAVSSAPAGLAAALAGASLAGAASEAGTTLGLLKFMVATKLKIGLSALAIAGAAVTLVLEHQAWLNAREENDSLRRQIAQLKADNDALSTRMARASRARSPHLPAPSLSANASGGALPGADSPSTNLYARLVENPPKITAAQLEGYLKTNHRNAASLLAAYRVTHDPALLAEAMQKYPNDPQVDFEAAFKSDATPEERRQWLSAFEKSAPDNSLANYLSALDYFKSGQSDLAVQEMVAASGKAGFQEYSTDRVMDDKEAYLAAGYSVGEATVLSCSQLELPQLKQVRQLGLDLIDLSKSYQQASDSASAQTTLQMAVALGQRYTTTAPGEAEISQLVGMAVERFALGAMDPTAPYGDSGQTVQDQLNQLIQERATLKELNQQADPLMQSLSDQDWISYKDRWMAFGEVAALRWLIGKYGQQ
ncbi:MAG: sigma-70 family RNA polymerase sigma factor [Verrucomicrobiota bacterium]|jgi:RNA polymerase sigma factor (sigma-70 family)